MRARHGQDPHPEPQPGGPPLHPADLDDGSPSVTASSPHDATELWPSPRHPSNDPDLLTPEERLGELAGIFAEGLRRLRRSRTAAAVSGTIPAESDEAGLEPSADSLPDGVRNQRRAP